MFKKKIIWLILVLFFPLTTQAETASPVLDPNLSNLAFFYFEIDKASFFDSDSFSAAVNFNAGPELFNAVSLSFNFSSDRLFLEKSALNSRICEFVIREKIDNQKGQYTLLCASAQAFSGKKSNIVNLKFKKLKTGKASLAIGSSSALYAADSLGTKIAAIPETHNIYLME